MRGGPYAAIALAVVSVSFSAIFISWSNSPYVTIALYRLAIASAILAPIVLLDRRRPLHMGYGVGIGDAMDPLGRRHGVSVGALVRPDQLARRAVDGGDAADGCQ